LESHKINTAIHYPLPIHLQPAYRGRLGEPGMLPVTEKAATEILSLPIFPELTFQEVQKVAGEVKAWVSRKEG
jgi:dTDP-4-amino-4,6-dideoxygalactose transaminase